MTALHFFAFIGILWIIALIAFSGLIGIALADSSQEKRRLRAIEEHRIHVVRRGL